jgi:nicotinamidase-related amidase
MIFKLDRISKKVKNNMKPLLIIVDLQKGWRHVSTEKAMLNSVALCQRFKGNIIHCRFQNDPNTLFYKQLNWYRFSESPDTDLIAEIVDLNIKSFWRSTYSCVTDETWPLIKDSSQVYLAGVFTDISIAMTAMHIFDKGVPVSVVSDCVGTLHGQSVHENALRSLEHAIGDDHLVISSSLI